METALDRIVKNYLIHEFQYEKPVRENGKDEKMSRNKNSSGEEVFNNLDEEYIHALHECLEKKGILRELQSFLRRKIVLVLQDKFPNFTVSSPTDFINPTVIKLLNDFLCCRQLLYTFSVFSSEIGQKNSGKVKFGKITCLDAESLLEEVGIYKDSHLSRSILKYYSEKEGNSLLECLIHTSVWSSSEESVLNMSTEDRFLQNFNFKDEIKKKRKITDRLKDVDEHFSTQQKNACLKDLGAEERFRAIEESLEKDKNIQLQIAIKRFREEEITNIKEEIQNKLQFEILAKENELLLNYKEKSECLKENLEREKAAWYAEKSRQENELEQKRTTLESMINSIEQKQAELENLISNAEVVNQSNEVVGPMPNTIRHMVSTSTSTQADYDSSLLHFQKQKPSLPYEIRDDAVMKEAQLRLIAKRLQEEINQLNTEKEGYVQRQMEKAVSDNPLGIQQENYERSKCIEEARFYHQEETDKMAFLQYNLERQAEEIKQLKQKLYLDKDAHAEKSSSSLSRNALAAKGSEADNLLNFLAESKQRCTKIEEEAKLVDKKLHEIRTRRSRSVSPVSYRQQVKKYESQQLPTVGPYTAKSKMLIEHIPTLNFYTPQQSVFTNQPIFSPLPARPMTFDEPLQQSSNNFEEPKEIQCNFNWLKQNKENLDPQRKSEEGKVEDSKTPSMQNEEREQNLKVKLSNPNDQNDVSEVRKLLQQSNETTQGQSHTKKPENRPVTEHKKIDAKDKHNGSLVTASTKVEKAIRKGALSFEKVTSTDDGDFSQCSSLRQDMSVRSNHFNSNIKENQATKVNEDFINKDTDEPEKAEKLVVEHQFKKYKIDDKSLALNNDHEDISHGSVDTDSEFWKI